MQLLTGTVLLALFATPGFAAENPPVAKKRLPASGTAKRSSKKTSKAKATSKAKVATVGSKTNVKSASKSSKKPALVSRRSAQQQPTASRYKEIQQALADKGYFAGSPDGNWGAESVDALKRFQHDQNLTEDGRIGSLSLIALGLGPQRVAAAASPAPAQ